MTQYTRFQQKQTRNQQKNIGFAENGCMATGHSEKYPWITIKLHFNHWTSAVYGHSHHDYDHDDEQASMQVKKKQHSKKKKSCALCCDAAGLIISSQSRHAMWHKNDEWKYLYKTKTYFCFAIVLPSNTQTHSHTVFVFDFGVVIYMI